jgi:hypothetical protein
VQQPRPSCFVSRHVAGGVDRASVRLRERSLARTRCSELTGELPLAEGRGAGWSIDGAERSQSVAIGRKWDGAENGRDRR